MLLETVEEIAEQLLQIFEQWAPSGTALSREWLRNTVGCSDRTLRQAVVHLREEGHLIIADGGGGYRLARNEGEVAAYTATLKSRVQALRTVINAMEAAAQQRFGGLPSQPPLI